MRESKKKKRRKRGEQEVENKTVNVRTRDNQVHGAKSIPQMLEEIQIVVKNF